MNPPKKSPLLLLALLALPLQAAAQNEGDAAPSPVEGLPTPTPAEPPLFAADAALLPPQELPDPLPSLSAQTCNACHGEIHDQWERSGHARSGRGILYRAALRAAGDPPLCRRCHLPLQAQHPDVPQGPTGVRRAVNPSYQPSLALEGVTCAACHVRDGVIIGPRSMPADRAPHPIERRRDLRGVEACASCHQAALPGGEADPFIDTVGEWRRSPFGEAGITCQQCHMQRRSGLVAGARYASYAGHAWTADRSPAMIRRAVTVDVQLRSATVTRGDPLRATVTLLNTGAGHAFPTGDPSKRVELRFTVTDEAGQPLDGVPPESHWLERSVGESAPFPTIEDSRLPAAGSRSYDFSWPVSKALKPGVLLLQVTLHRWAASEAAAKLLGVDPEGLHREVLRQEIPIRIE